MPGKLYIPVGIPGCGKSHWATNSDYFVVSTDAIRATLGDVNDQSKNDEVFEKFHRRLHMVLVSDQSVVADATNLRDFARERLRDIALANNAETHLIVFQNPLQALMRNRQRERTVPEDVMYRMVDQFERALVDISQEIYTTVTKIRSYA
jgi:predicted kinase